jgi:hypothetical protein
MKAPLKPRSSFHEAILVVVVDLWVAKSQKVHSWKCLLLEEFSGVVECLTESNACPVFSF